MISFKKINLNCSHYFFSGIKNVDPNLLSIKKIYTKNTDVVIYSIKYITMESINNQNIDSESPLCLSFSDADAYITEKIGYEYLIFALTETNKEVLGLCRKLWSEIKKQIKATNSGDSVKYEDYFMKIRLD